jgi:hypothetical protein
MIVSRGTLRAVVPRETFALTPRGAIMLGLHVRVSKHAIP